MKVIIIGCTYAGMVAANQILKRQPATEVTLYDRNAVIPSLPSEYDEFGPTDLNAAVPLPVPAIGPEELIATGATIKTGSVVIGVDPNDKSVKVLEMMSDNTTIDHYDKLIIANDPLKQVPSIEGIDSLNVTQFSSQQDLRVILATSLAEKEEVVIGNDLLSLGLVAAYHRQGKNVTLIKDGQPLLDARFAEKFSNRLSKLLADNDIKVVDAQVNGLIDNGIGITVKTTQGEIRADKAAISVAPKPDTDLYKGVLEQNDDGTLVTNDLLQTSNSDIYVVGGSAQVLYNPSKAAVYAPTMSEGARQAVTVAANITGKQVHDFGTQLSASLSIGDTTMAVVGLSVKAAQEAGINADSITIEDNYRPEFMPTTTPVMMTLVWEQETQRILGAQFMSKHDISQSINLISLCIQNQNTIEFLGMYDTMFQPNFDRAFNYVNLLGQAAMAKVDNNE